MYAFVFIAILLLPVQPVTKTEQPSVKHQHGNTVANDKSNQKWDGQPQVIFSVNQHSEPLKGQPDPRAKQQTDDDRTHENFYRAYVIFTIIGSLAAVSALIVLICQTRATTIAAVAAKDGVTALRNIERPWVVITIKDGVSDFKHRVSTGETLLYFNWTMTNTGKTPAFVYETRAFLEIKTWDECEELKCIHPESKPTIRPDKFIVTPNEIHDCPGIQKDVYWTNEERTAVSNGKKFLVAYGSVKYRDSFESTETHETPFIGVYVFTPDEFLKSKGKFRRLYDAPGYNEYT